MRLLRTTNFWILVCLTLSLWPSMGLCSSTNQTAKPKILPLIKEEPISEDPDSISRKEATRPSYDENHLPISEESIKKMDPLIFKDPDGGFHLGGLSGNSVSSQEAKLAFVGGAYFVFAEKRGFNQFEINLQSDQIINIALTKRWRILSYEETMKPYWTAGFVNYMDAKAGLAGLVTLSHFKIRGAVGLSDLFESHEKYYSEIGLGFGQSGIVIDFKIGHTFSF